MCRTCFNDKRKRESLDICMTCGEVDVFLDGYCEDCYKKRNNIKRDVKKGFCIACSEERLMKNREMCNTCYDKFYRPVKLCVKCDELKIIHGKNMCKVCYMQ